MSRLVLGKDGGGLRHFLDGNPVHAGTVLELQLADGKWLQVRYEGEWLTGTIRPRFFLELGPTRLDSEGEVTNGYRNRVEFEVPESAELRRPSDKTGRLGEHLPHPDTVGRWPTPHEVRNRSVAP